MDLLAYHNPTCLGSTFEALSRVEFDNPYSLALTFPVAREADATLAHAFASCDVARFIDAMESESITPIRRRSGWKFRTVVFSDTSTDGLIRFHLLISNPTEFTDAQIRFAVIRSQRVLKLDGVAVSAPHWCIDWQGFADNLIDLPAETLSYEFGLSQLYGVE
jgi:hypothetical protein